MENLILVADQNQHDVWRIMAPEYNFSDSDRRYHEVCVVRGSNTYAYAMLILRRLERGDA